MRRLRYGLLAAFVAVLAAPVLPQADKKDSDDRFQALLLSVAGSYESYQRLEENLRVAPTSCVGPRPAPVRDSRSKDDATHGGKLYYLYALDPEAYLPSQKGRMNKPGKIPVFDKKAVDQVLVKQSWTAVPVENTDLRDRTKVVERGTKKWTLGERRELFIMARLDAKTEGSDNGWVYGTVSADGKSVTSSGRVSSCMACHEKAGEGRLFGLPGK